MNPSQNVPKVTLSNSEGSGFPGFSDGREILHPRYRRGFRMTKQRFSRVLIFSNWKEKKGGRIEV